MAKRASTKPEGLVSRSDASGNTTWSAGHEVYAQNRFIPELLSQFFASSAAPCIELSMALLDAVHPSSLSDIVEQGSSPYVLDGLHYLEWWCSQSSVTQRRTISAHTARHWPKKPANIAGPCVSPFLPLDPGHQTRLENALNQLSPGSRLNYFEACLVAWWSVQLPPVLFAHLAMIQAFNAVPRATLARAAFMKPKAAETLEAEALDNLGASGEFLDAAMASASEDLHSGVLQLAVEVFRTKTSKIDGLVKRYWLAELKKLLNQSLHAGPWACLIMAWGCYMIEYGTVMESNPAAGTLQSYFGMGAMAIHRTLTDMPHDFADPAWSSEVLSEVFQLVIDGQSVGNQATMRAALRSFHAFMVEYFDIEPMQHRLSVDKISRPSANHIWPHELTLARNWARTHPDFYIGAPAQVVLAIAGEAPCRAGELMRLRVGHIHFATENTQQFCEIEIAREARSGRLKTPSSQRRVCVRSSTSVRLLKAWIRLRRRQGAGPQDFLFGAPADLQVVYKPNAVLAWCAALLRAASGDATVRVHTLRHSVISVCASELLLSSPHLDVNRLEVLAAEAGHASPTTTLYTYTHLYEQALRLWLDVVSQSAVVMKSSWAPHLLNESAPAIRQAASRAKESASDRMWHFLRQDDTPICDASSWPLVNHTPPEPPLASTHSDRHFSVGVARQMLLEITRSTPIQTLGWRYAFAAEKLHEAVQQLQKFCMSLARTMHPRKHFSDESHSDLANGLHEAHINLLASEQPKYAKLWEALEKGPDPALLNAAVDSWFACKTGTLISLEQPSKSLALMRLLQSGNLDLSGIRICIQGEQQAEKVEGRNTLVASPRITSLAREIDTVYCALFNVPAKFLQVVKHPDRPDAYLRWNTAGTEGESGGSTRGLDAVMVFLKFFLILSKKYD